MDATRSMQAVDALRRVYGTHEPRHIDPKAIRSQIADAVLRLNIQAESPDSVRQCDDLAATVRGLLAQIQSLRAQFQREEARMDDRTD
ncbi:MAG: hypothetical protein J0L65_11115 [Xanthomonadales bacterium]|nr:hypothetical protein [Xanthomonadales bacterium]